MNTVISDPLTYFSRYFESAHFENLVEMTNVYALQKGHNFSPTNLREMKTFIGLHLGCLKFPQLKMYWDSLLGMNLFTDMTRERFMTLRTNFHVVNVFEKPSDCKDRWYKVRLIFDAIKKRCWAIRTRGGFVHRRTNHTPQGKKHTMQAIH